MVRAIVLLAIAQPTIERQMTCVGRGLFVLLALALIATPASGQAVPSAVTWSEKIEVAAGGGFRGRVVKKLGRALGASLVWSESTAAGHVVPGSSDLLRPIEGGANS